MNLKYFLVICSFIVIPDVQPTLDGEMRTKTSEVSTSSSFESSSGFSTLTGNEITTLGLKSDETKKYASSQEIASESEPAELVVSATQQENTRLSTDAHDEKLITDLNKQTFETDKNAATRLEPNETTISSQDTTSESETERTSSGTQQENTKLSTDVHEETSITDLVNETTFEPDENATWLEPSETTISSPDTSSESETEKTSSATQQESTKLSTDAHEETSVTNLVDVTTFEPDNKNCNLTNSSFELNDINELTINWTMDSLIQYCSFFYVKIELTFRNCNISLNSQNCTKTIDRMPIANLTYTYPEILEACGAYEYKIYESQFEDEGARITRQFTSKPQYQNFQVEVDEQEDHDRLRVFWNYTQHPLCPRKFRIEVYLKNAMIKSLVVDKLSEMIDNLEPCEEYFISVDPMQGDDVLSNYGSNITYEMSPIIPTGIRNLTLTYSKVDNLININWLPPTTGSKCITTFEARAESDYDNRTKTVENTKETFPNVFACVIYKIEIIANTINQMKTAPVTDEIPIPSKAFKAPSTPRVVDITSKTVTLNVSIDAVSQLNYCKVNRVDFSCVNEKGNQISKIDKTLSFELGGLSPYTRYECTARVENSASMGEDQEFSQPSDETIILTKEAKPDRPTVTLTQSTMPNSSCSFKWTPPLLMNGEIKNYNIFIIFGNFSYSNPSNCETSFKREVKEIVNSEADTSYVFEDAIPAAIYFIQVQVENNDYQSEFSSVLTCETQPGPANEVRNLSVASRNLNLSEPFDRNTNLTWSLPCRANGRIDKFTINCSRSDVLQSFNYLVDVTDDREEYSFITGDLAPDSIYNISIRAVTFNHAANEQILGKETTERFQIEAGLPDLTELENIVITTQPSTKLAKLILSSDIFKSSVGRITKILLLLAELNCGNTIEKTFGFLHDEKPRQTWKDVEGMDCIPQYQTAALVEDDVKASQKNNDLITFTIGSEICDSNSYLYCNGPLIPGKMYALTMRFFTRKGFSDNDYITIETEKETPLFLISISILSVMCIVFVIGFYISYRRTRTLRQQSNDSPNDNKDILINEFANFHRGMIDNSTEKIKEEYKAIQAFSDSLIRTCIASVANEKLNRYSNISPFDCNRVVLNDDEFDNDYINASYINGYHCSREYIAAQGPKPNTGHDFWRMVLQHKAESIVMLTSLIENNKVKCHEYFPRLNGQITFANIKVTCKSEESHAHFIKRIMDVEKDGDKHIVKHYYFTMWPDHGTPLSASELIEFCKIFRSERQNPDGTIIVHCSAGVGRTGTFIALDIMMQRIKQEKKVNIFDLVKQLRAQRMKMVQTLDQYVFLYTSGLKLAETRRQQPQVFQNLALYLNELNLFNRLKKGSRTFRDNESSL